MPTPPTIAPADWDAARHALAEAVRRAATPDASRFRRIEVAAPAGAAPLAWLRCQPAPRGFWQGRGGEATARAFTGVADRFEDPACLCARLAERPAAGAPLRYYGGTRFDPERPAGGGWQRFGPGAFVLPRLELVRRDGGDRAHLVAYVAPGDAAEQVASQVEQMALPGAPPPDAASLPAVARRTDRPDPDGWERNVQRALDAMGESRLQKVVLARQTTLRLDAPLDAVALMGRLRDAAPEGLAFFIQPEQAGAFLGVSPERLFRQRGRRVESEAVAGTRPRAAAAVEDAALRDELLQSEKDRREHAFVQRYVAGALRPLCTSLGEEDAAPLTLRRGRHLRARLQGRLREGVAPAEVLRALHPTPAVGGVPPPVARAFIRDHEPFDRGWYAAPVGWMGREDGAPAAELAVGLRSGLARRSDATLELFAGAGLVDGSVPQQEWGEVEQKLGNFAALFGGL
jgi:menaquinone-specific isochorismate synthase